MVGGGVGWDPTTSTGDIAAFLGNAAFAPGAVLGFDTTNGNFVYNDAITDTNVGPLGVVVSGGNALTLSGSSSYSGDTVISSWVRPFWPGRPRR